MAQRMGDWIAEGSQKQKLLRAESTIAIRRRKRLSRPEQTSRIKQTTHFSPAAFKPLAVRRLAARTRLRRARVWGPTSVFLLPGSSGRAKTVILVNLISIWLTPLSRGRAKKN